MALSNKKKKMESKRGFYVARRRTTGMFWALTATVYDLYAEEFEHGTFFKTFEEAATKADEYNEEAMRIAAEQAELAEEDEEDNDSFVMIEEVTTKKGNKK